MEVISEMVAAFVAGLGPHLGWLIPVAVLLVVARLPMPGRGPNSTTRDAWRGFKYGARGAVFARAGDRCEGAGFLAWGRCSSAAVEVDHVFPWSRGGPTVVPNGQALCTAHNRSKGAMTPPWWYVLSLERRRLGYFPEGTDVRVFAVLSAADAAARTSAVGVRSRTRSGR